MSVMALAALATPDAGQPPPEPEPEPETFTAVHANIGVLIGPSVTGGRSLLQPSVRVIYADTGSLLMSGSLFWVSEDGGTDRIKASQWLIGAEGGAALGYPFGAGAYTFTPHFGASLSVAAGARTRVVDDDAEVGALFKAGAMLNAGALVRLSWSSLFADMGGGMLGLEPHFRVRFGIGGAF